MADEGLDVPAINQRPSLTGYEWLWQAFVNLSSCRQIGMAYGPIPWHLIQLYGVAHQLSQDELWELHVVIRKMDDIFLAHTHDKKR